MRLSMISRVGLMALIMTLSWCSAAADDTLVYELRTYTTHEGKLDALHARFRDHTMRLFEKHGMRNIGYWIPIDKPNTLVYLIAHPSRAAAAVNWRAFGQDPEWRAVAKASNAQGPILIQRGITSQFMSAADYSPIR